MYLATQSPTLVAEMQEVRLLVRHFDRHHPDGRDRIRKGRLDGYSRYIVRRSRIAARFGRSPHQIAAHELQTVTLNLVIL